MNFGIVVLYQIIRARAILYVKHDPDEDEDEQYSVWSYSEDGGQECWGGADDWDDARAQMKQAVIEHGETWNPVTSQLPHDSVELSLLLDG